MDRDWFKRHLFVSHHWHPISTAPYNQELEIRIVEDGKPAALEFPCLRTNDEAWINVDLGSEMNIQPIEWRQWHRSKSLEPHHSKIKFADRSAVTHPNDHGRRQANDSDDGDAF